MCELYPAPSTITLLQCWHFLVKRSSRFFVKQLRHSCVERSSCVVHLAHHNANRSTCAPEDLRFPLQLMHTAAARHMFTLSHDSHALARRHGRQNPFSKYFSSLQIYRHSNDSFQFLRALPPFGKQSLAEWYSCSSMQLFFFILR